MKVTFKTGSEANYGSTNGEMFFASDTKQLLLNGVKYIPKKLSELTNDSGFLTSITKSMVENVLTGNVTSHTHTTLSLLSVGTKNTPIYLSGGTPTAVSTIKESLLTYGEDTSDGNVSALDMATFPLFCTNRLAFGNPDGVTVEYSRDGGTTWLDYNKSDADKVRLISNMETPCFVGGSNTSLTVTTDCKLRITLNAKKIGVYTRPKKLFIKYTTFGVKNSTVLVEYAKSGSPTNFTILDTYNLGVDGWRSIPIGRLMTFGGSDTQINNNSVIRLTINLGTLSSTQNNRSFVRSIMLFGETDWTVPSNTATNGFLYAWDNEQNAIFPAKITSTAFIKSGSSNSYILLGAGGTKALSELALATDLSKYLPLTGGTLSGNITCNGSYINMSGASGAKGYRGYFNNSQSADRAAGSHIFQGTGWAYGTNAISIGYSAYAGIRNTDSDSGTYPYLHWQWMDCLQVQETTSGTAVNCYGAILTNAGGNKDTATFSLCIGDMCVAYGGTNNSEELNNFLSFTNTNASNGRVVVYIADNKSGDTNERIFAGTTSYPRRQSNVKIGNVLLGQGCNITDVASMSVNGVTVYRVAFYFWNKTLPATYDITQKTTAMVCTKVNNNNYSGASSYASGAYSVASGSYSVASGSYSVASGYSSVASGYSSVASDYSSVASGSYSVASGSYSVASGNYSVASGASSVASGYSSVASGYSSVASGYSSVASGNYSIASGAYSVASGNYSVASGNTSVASGYSSVASGASSVASGSYSVAMNYKTIAGTYQLAIGRRNASVDAPFVIGNGSGDNVSDANAIRQNCFVVDWNGNATFGVGGAATVTAATFKGALSGNATSATVLANKRKVTVGGASEDFDGSKDISFDLSEIITNTSHINVGSINVSDGLESYNVTIKNHLELGTNADVSGLTPSKIGAAAESHTHTFGDLNGVAAASHTHLYAGSASAGGAATSAVKLNTSRKLWGQSFDGSADVYGNIYLYPSDMEVATTRGIREFSLTGFIGFVHPSIGDTDNFSGICLGWASNPTSADASLRINASTFAYKGNTVWHGGNLKLGYTSSGLLRAVQKDSSNKLYVVAPSLFEQGISNNYPKNLRWITDDEGQLVFDTEEAAGVPSTVQVSIPVADKTSKGFMKSISTVTDVTGYTPCPVKSGTPYYKLDAIELDYTDFFEIGSGSIEDNLSITNPWITPIPNGGSLEYLLNYGVNNIPRLLTIDLGGYWKYFFWLQQTDNESSIVAYYHCQFNDLWIVIDSPNREIRISRGGF